MAVRFLVVMIDDDRPLGPQLKAAREFAKVSWKHLHDLTGGISTRHLQRLVEMSSFCDRQAVRRGITLLPEEPACGPVGRDGPGADDVTTMETT